MKTTWQRGLAVAAGWLAAGVRIAGAEDAPDAETLRQAALAMEDLASAEELRRYPGAIGGPGYLVFTEDRLHAVRRDDGLPRRWLGRNIDERTRFAGRAQPGEFYVFQVAVAALRSDLEDVRIEFLGLKGRGEAVIDPRDFRCLNLGGVGPDGRAFTKTVRVPRGQLKSFWVGVDIPPEASGLYGGRLNVQPAGVIGTPVHLALTVEGATLADHGEGEAWRLARLRWLDSTLAIDDRVPAPYRALRATADSVAFLGRRLRVDASGLPAQIESFFTASNTRIGEAPRALLAAPARFVVETAAGPVAWKAGGLAWEERAPDRVTWTATSEAPGLTLACAGEAGYDGKVSLRMTLAASAPARLADARLEIPYRREAAAYAMGLGLPGGRRPEAIAWTWDVAKQQDALWMGDVNVGAMWRFKDEQYRRPLNNIYYTFHPLVLPASWGNGGRGGIRVAAAGEDTVLLAARSGPRALEAGQEMQFDVDLYLTPFRPLDPDAQWPVRYRHHGGSADDIAQATAQGATVLNVHHAQPENPYINYPFSDRAFPALAEAGRRAHDARLRIKPYFTTREFSVHAPEFWALFSLDGEVIFPGPGNACRTLLAPKGPDPWLAAHVRANYIPAWRTALGGPFAGETDLAVITTPDTRWNNVYVEGVRYLAERGGMDGVYIDDTLLDRAALQRVRKVLDARRPRGLIDLHAWNHFNAHAGFASCAAMYMELVPYVDRLWFGESFDYGQPPDYWLVEVSGIPFGLTGEMLQGGGNPWRGMLYGMTSRHYGGGDPRPVWRVLDEFGMDGSELRGFWDPACPVRTGRPDILASVFLKRGRALVAVASWAKEAVEVELAVDWKALGLSPEKAWFRAPASEGLQEAATFAPGARLPVASDRGWLLLAEPAKK